MPNIRSLRSTLSAMRPMKELGLAVNPTESKFKFWYLKYSMLRGKLTYPDGRQYSGKFAYGLFHGYGELLVRTTDLSSSTNTSNTPSSLMNSIFYTQPKNLLDLSYSLKGSFKNGQLNGLGIAAFLNGDSYQGYFHKDQMHGHGVYKTNGSTYVGGFRNNLRNGYGVLSSNSNNVD